MKTRGVASHISGRDTAVLWAVALVAAVQAVGGRVAQVVVVQALLDRPAVEVPLAAPEEVLALALALVVLVYAFSAN